MFTRQGYVVHHSARFLGISGQAFTTHLLTNGREPRRRAIGASKQRKQAGFMPWRRNARPPHTDEVDEMPTTRARIHWIRGRHPQQSRTPLRRRHRSSVAKQRRGGTRAARMGLGCARIASRLGNTRQSQRVGNEASKRRRARTFEPSRAPIHRAGGYYGVPVHFAPVHFVLGWWLLWGSRTFRPRLGWWLLWDSRTFRPRTFCTRLVATMGLAYISPPVHFVPPRLFYGDRVHSTASGPPAPCHRLAAHERRTHYQTGRRKKSFCFMFSPPRFLHTLKVIRLRGTPPLPVVGDAHALEIHSNFAPFTDLDRCTTLSAPRKF